MSSSDITVAALTASPTLRGNKLAWTYSDPRNNALPNIGLDVVEVHASTTNDRTTATKVGEGITDFTHAGLVEEQTWYYWIKARDYLGGYGAWYPSGSTSGVSATAIGMSGLAFGLANGKLVATVAGNALTVAIKTAAGNDPSAADPMYVAFRNATLSVGGYSIISLTAALSVTVPNGKTLSTVNGAPFRLWAKISNDGGTLRLGIENCYDVAYNYIYPIPEYGLESTTAIGGLGVGFSAGVTYSTVAVSSKPYRIVGFLNWNTGLATAGVWSARPDEIQMYSGGPRPGQIVQDSLQTLQGLSSSITGVIPFDATKPQSSEGYQIGSRVITPTSPINLVYNEVRLPCSYSIANTVTIALFKSPATDAMAAGWADVRAADVPAVLQLVDCRQALTASQITYLYNVGGSSAGTFYLCGNSAGAIYNNLLGLFLRCTEIMI